MDNYIQNEFNNPINYNEESRYCEVCDIEENKTYFVDHDCICQDCFEEEEEKEYVEEYILPNETKENKKLYYNGCLQYDKEYIKDHKKYNTLYDNDEPHLTTETKAD